MTLETRLAPEYTIPSQDVEFFHRALVYYRDNLAIHKEWVRGSGLPGEEIALAEIEQQIKALNAAMTRLFNASWSKGAFTKPVTYVAPEPWPTQD